MELPAHTLNSLFDQLGLDDSDEAIETFINRHKPIPDDTALHDADFWSNSQSSFLCEAIRDDADWAEVVDQLNALMRH